MFNVIRAGAANIDQIRRTVKLWQRAGILILALALIFVVSGCGSNNATPSKEGTPAQDGDTVKVNYTLKLDDGSVFQTSVGSDPLEFTIGSGQLIPGFNDAVIGMKPGESKSITILAADAYGPILDELIVEVDRSELPETIIPEVGMILQANGNGQTKQVTIIAVSDTSVTIDTNHPLAGKDLIFEIELVEIL